MSPYWTTGNGVQGQPQRRFVIDTVYSPDARQLLGADVLEFDGRPILNAIRRIGQMSGCRRENEDCVRRGVLALTIRSLTRTGVVQEPTVDMKVRDLQGNERVVKLEWMLDYDQPITPPEDDGSQEPSQSDDDGGMQMSSASERSNGGDGDEEEEKEGKVQSEERDEESTKSNDNAEDELEQEQEQEDVKETREALKRFTQRLEVPHDITNNRLHAAAAKLSNTVHTLSSPSSSNIAHSLRASFSSSSAPASTSTFLPFGTVGHQGGFPSPLFKRNRLNSSHELLNATTITPTNGTAFGVLRIESFSPSDPEAFLAEAGRLLSLLPSTGLVVDVRRNPGGLSTMTGALFQMIFSRTDESGGGGPSTLSALPYSYPLVMRATRLMLRVLGRRTSAAFGARLRRLIGRHVETGAEFTGPWTDIPLGLSFDATRKYKGDRVVVLTDSTSFSAAELFTMLVKESDYVAQKRLVLGTDPSTNGAGATVNTLSDIAESVMENSGDEEEKRIFGDLPKGVDATTATFRFYRAGRGAMGELVEHYGVPADEVYYENLLDAVFEDEALFTYIGQMIGKM